MTSSNLLYTVSGIAVAVSLALSYHFFTVSSLNSEIVQLQKSNKTLTTNYDLSQNKLHEQSEKILSLAVDFEKNSKELEEWKSKKPEIRYEKIYRYREVKSDDCEDVKNNLDGIRTIDFSKL